MRVEKAVENLGEEAPLLHAEPAHDAEIDGDDAALVVDEQIAGMHVGMEEAVAHGMPQEALHQERAERLHLVAGGGKRVAIGNRDAVDPFQRQHAPRAARPIDLRHAETCIVLGVLGHLGESGGLHAKIHLDGNGLRQSVDHGDRPKPPGGPVEPLDHARGEDVRVEILLEALLDAGAQHLDRDRLERAVRHPHLGLMHLRDRSGGDRGTELGIERIDGRAQRLLDGGARLALRERRQPVLQRGEIAGKLPADQVVAGGEKLAELDVRGPKRGQRLGELGLVRRIGGAVARAGR